MSSKGYTAQEMRDAADCLEIFDFENLKVDNNGLATMLRQAAEAIEREKKECEAIERLSLSATDGMMRYYDYRGKLIREEAK